MEGISDLKIVGMDPLRPPKIQKRPCIDLVFTLSHKAPKAWCDAFNVLMGKEKYGVKIDPEAGLFVETWVRSPDEIARNLATVKRGVATCITEYVAMVEAKAREAEGRQTVVGGGPSAEQLKLDAVVAALSFDE